MIENKAKLEAWVVKIQNQERMVRQRALKEFLEFCAGETLNSENAVEVFDTTYLCLIKTYSDKFEMCRSLACSIVTEILKHLEQNDYYLSLLVPVIAKRLAPQEVVEESEEMRLQLLKQLNSIIDKYKDMKGKITVRPHSDGEDRLLKPYNDIVDILKTCLMDSYPAILKECCDIIKLTAIASPSFHYRAEALALPLITMLKHRHSTIRVAAIEALGVVALNIHTNADMVKRIIKEISPIVMDPVPSVRRECGRVGCKFLLEMRDRYSHFERIMPLVLCCLTDEIDEVREEIEKLWEAAGALYYQENEAELQNLDMIDCKPENYPKAIVKRPTVGCRALVKRSLQVLNIVLHEMEDWKEDVRLHSTKLLMQIVIHSEEHLATKYYDINAVLCKTCQDSDAAVAKQALLVAHLIGYFVNQKTWSKYTFEELKVRQSKLGVIKCLNALYGASFDENLYENVEELSEILLDNTICHNSSSIFQAELIQLLERLIPGITTENVEKNFYVIALKVTSIAYDDESMRNIGMETLKHMVERCKLESLSNLHGRYLKAALNTLDMLDKRNSESFEQVIVLYGIICICGVEKSFIDDLKRVIVLALENCEAEGKIKILSGIAMATLNWDQTIDVKDPTENFLIQMSFINDCIASLLIWHAGRTAESVRTMATAALCSLTQGTSQENARKIVESLMVPLVSLIDDNSIATRNYVLKIFMHADALNYEQLKTLASALLSRLDDPGSEVRERAAKCLGRLKLKSGENEEDEFGEMWQHLLKQILNTMLIHLESPEIDLRNALIQSIIDLSKTSPTTYREALNESTISQELKTKLPSAA